MWQIEKKATHKVKAHDYVGDIYFFYFFNQILTRLFI